MATIKIIDTTGNVQFIRNTDRETFRTIAGVVASDGAMDINFAGADPGFPTVIQYGKGQIVRAEWVPNE